jgi:hypothetical protein
VPEAVFTVNRKLAVVGDLHPARGHLVIGEGAVRYGLSGGCRCA